MTRILAITDFATEGSGYKTISAPLLTEIVGLGYEVKVIGVLNKGEEHNYPYSVLPASSIEEAQVMAGNLCQLWTPDVVLAAFDLPVQAKLHSSLQPYLARTPREVQDGITEPRKYIAITPLENGPLCVDWAIPLFNMDSVFFISSLGKEEAIKAGVAKAEHLQIGEDTSIWRPPFPEERKRLREGLGISDETFVILTVAENQERKNLWASMEAVRRLKQSTQRPVRYILVSRENGWGWKLRSLAVELGISSQFHLFEKGIPQKDLWGLYAIADVYLQTSKAEGLGLPLLDAMACKVPVVATDTGAMHELLADARGWLIPAAYRFRDVWGNSWRDMIDVDMATVVLEMIADGRWEPVEQMNTERAYEYVKARTWKIPAAQIDAKIRELYHEPKTETK